MNTKSVVSALAALPQESRLAIFRVLVQAGPEGLAAGKIGDATDIAPSSLSFLLKESFHLKELPHADLIDSRQDGRFVIYSARYATMDTLIGYLTENCCGGVPCLECEPTPTKEKKAKC